MKNYLQFVPHVLSDDYNCDGDITIADAVLLMHFLTEDAALTAEETETLLNSVFCCRRPPLS